MMVGPGNRKFKNILAGLGLPVPFRILSLELALARSKKQRRQTATEKRDDAGPNGDERMVLPENFDLRRSA